MPRGAPRGNQNARKHGFYSRVLRESSRAVFDDASAVSGIDEEIALIRFRLRELVRKDPDNVKLQLEATKILASLLKTRCHLGGGIQDTYEKALLKVWTDVAVPFGVTSFPVPDTATKPEDLST